MVKVAIPQLGDSVAPRFEAANAFVIGTIDGNDVVSSVTIFCDGPEGYRRIRMLQIHRVNVLICNGIKASYLDMLKASGVTVISKVSATIGDALQLFLKGELASEGEDLNDRAQVCTVPHQELINRARTVFETYGYVVTTGPGEDAFLIDLVAEISCPVCGRPVKVAICCGAHTYRMDLEITEFHRATSSGYHARVLVCQSRPSILKYCREYGIELIDPDQAEVVGDSPADNAIPLLRGPVADHEQASGGGSEDRG
ncbi:MAG: NifB/NifX family molybdenum-iron cluster-binding protein [bacterium]